MCIYILNPGWFGIWIQGIRVVRGRIIPVTQTKGKVSTTLSHLHDQSTVYWQATIYIGPVCAPSMRTLTCFLRSNGKTNVPQSKAGLSLR